MEVNVEELMAEIEAFQKDYIKNSLIETITEISENEIPEQAVNKFTNILYNAIAFIEDLSTVELQKEIEISLQGFSTFLDECGITDIGSDELAKLHNALDDIYLLSYKAVAKFIISKFNPENKPLVTESI